MFVILSILAAVIILLVYAIGFAATATAVNRLFRD